MQLIIISGRSGSGKSVALHMLEDLGFYCVDGLPTSLLPDLVKQVNQSEQKLAASIDARNFPADFSLFQQALTDVKAVCNNCKIIFLNSDDNTLLKRFSETRRRHPLTNNLTSLNEALQREEELLHPLLASADLEIDTSHLSIHQLRGQIRKFVTKNATPPLSLLFLSFGYKNGLPNESDYIFDVRCLPNPYWEPKLRQFTGIDPAIRDYLESSQQTLQMTKSISQFLDTWVPCFAADNRQYLTIAIGCTGGLHRSVYIAERLAEHFQHQYQNIQVRHRDLP